MLIGVYPNKLIILSNYSIVYEDYALNIGYKNIDDDIKKKKNLKIFLQN